MSLPSIEPAAFGPNGGSVWSWSECHVGRITVGNSEERDASIAVVAVHSSEALLEISSRASLKSVSIGAEVTWLQR